MDTSTDRADRGRFMLLPEDPSITVAAAAEGRPRVRRYRLTRLAGDGGASRAGAERRPVGDFAHLRRTYD